MLHILTENLWSWDRLRIHAPPEWHRSYFSIDIPGDHRWYIYFRLCDRFFINRVGREWWVRRLVWIVLISPFTKPHVIVVSLIEISYILQFLVSHPMKNDVVSTTFAYIQGFDLLITQGKEDHRLWIIKVQPLVVMNQMHRAISMIGRFFTFCYEIASNPIVTEFITVWCYVTILIPSILFFVCSILIHRMPLNFLPSIPLRVSLKLV